MRTVLTSAERAPGLKHVSALLPEVRDDSQDRKKAQTIVLAQLAAGTMRRPSRTLKQL